MSQPSVCPGCRAALAGEIAPEASGALRCPRCRTRLLFSLDERTRTPVAYLDEPVIDDTRRGLLRPMLVVLGVLMTLTLAQQTITMPTPARVVQPIAPPILKVVNPPTPTPVAPSKRIGPASSY